MNTMTMTANQQLTAALDAVRNLAEELEGEYKAAWEAYKAARAINTPRATLTSMSVDLDVLSARACSTRRAYEMAVKASLG